MRQIEQITIPDVEGLQDKGFWVHPGNVTDANAVLADGVHTISWGGAANYPFTAGILLVKHDGSQRCDLAFGESSDHKVAVRRWDNGTPGNWVIIASEDWVIAKNYATQAYVATKIAELVDSSPAALDTLNELAAALGDDPNFATTITNLIAQKANLNDPRFHTHANKAILDAINQAKVDEWDTNNASGKVDKAGDEMTGKLGITVASGTALEVDGDIKSELPELFTKWMVMWDPADQVIKRLEVTNFIEVMNLKREVVVDNKPSISIGSAHTMIATYAGAISVSLPSPSSVEGEIFELNTNNSNQLTLSSKITDVATGAFKDVFFGSIKIVAVSGAWYKVGG